MAIIPLQLCFCDQENGFDICVCFLRQKRKSYPPADAKQRITFVWPNVIEYQVRHIQWTRNFKNIIFSCAKYNHLTIVKYKPEIRPELCAFTLVLFETAYDAIR